MHPLCGATSSKEGSSVACYESKRTTPPQEETDMKIYCLKNVALLARKRQLVIDLMSHVLLDEVVGEPLQGKVPELHPSGAPELTHGFYSGFCYAIFSFLCSDCSFVPFFGRCILCHSSI